MWGSDCNIWTFELFRHLAVLLPRKIVNTFLCLYCQKKQQENLIKKRNIEVMWHILQRLQQQRSSQVVDESSLDAWTYHSSCAKKVSLSITYAKKRIASSSKEEVTDVSQVKKPLTQSEVCAFNSLLCVYVKKKLPSLFTGQSDNQLKYAFHTAPKSLAAVRVRCENSRDAHTGKYKRTSCSCNLFDFVITEVSHYELL